MDCEDFSGSEERSVVADSDSENQGEENLYMSRVMCTEVSFPLVHENTGFSPVIEPSFHRRLIVEKKTFFSQEEMHINGESVLRSADSHGDGERSSVTENENAVRAEDDDILTKNARREVAGESRSENSCVSSTQFSLSRGLLRNQTGYGLDGNELEVQLNHHLGPSLREKLQGGYAEKSDGMDLINSHDSVLAPAVVRCSARLSNRQLSGKRTLCHLDSHAAERTERPETLNRVCTHQGKNMVLRSNTRKNLSLSRIHRRNRFGETLLHLAVMDRDIKLVRDILQAGTSANKADNAGWTPLHEAVAVSHCGIVVALLQAGAVVNSAGDKGVTALHDAIAFGNYKIAELLLSSGADALQKNDDGRSALDMATDASLRKLIERYQPEAKKFPAHRRSECSKFEENGSKTCTFAKEKLQSTRGVFKGGQISVKPHEKNSEWSSRQRSSPQTLTTIPALFLRSRTVVQHTVTEDKKTSKGQHDLQEWCCQSGSKIAKSAVKYDDTNTSFSSEGFSQEQNTFTKIQESLGGEELLKDGDLRTAGDMDAGSTKPTIVINKAGSGQVIAEGTKEDAPHSDSTPAIAVDSEKEHSKLFALNCGEQFNDDSWGDKTQENTEPFSVPIFEETTVCCVVENQMKEQNHLQRSFDFEQYQDVRNETERYDVNRKQKFCCYTDEPMLSLRQKDIFKITEDSVCNCEVRTLFDSNTSSAEDYVKENMDECSISLLNPYGRESSHPCVLQTMHSVDKCEGQRPSVTSNSSPLKTGSHSSSGSSTPSLLLEEVRSCCNGFSVSDLCEASIAELDALQHKVSGLGEKYDLCLSERRSECLDVVIKKRSALVCENDKPSTPVKNVLVVQQDNNCYEPTVFKEHTERTMRIHLLSTNELSYKCNTETPYPEEDASTNDLHAEKFCEELEANCGSPLMSGFVSHSSRTVSQEKGRKVTGWLLDTNNQMGSRKVAEVTDLTDQTEANENAGLKCQQELLSQQSLLCQSEFHVSSRMSKTAMAEISGSEYIKDGALQSENGPSLIATMYTKSSWSPSKPKPTCNGTNNGEENFSFDSDCTYVSETSFLKGTETRNLNDDSLNSGTSQDASTENLKRTSKKRQMKLGLQSKKPKQQKCKSRFNQDNANGYLKTVNILDNSELCDRSVAKQLGHSTTANDLHHQIPCSVSQEDLKIPFQNIHKRNCTGESYLHKASRKGNLSLVKSLIKAGINVNMTDYAGWTALHEASVTGHTAVIEELLQAGADVRSRGLGGITPLHDAVAANHYEAVQVLLQHGSDPEDRDECGQRSMDITCDETIRELLSTFHGPFLEMCEHSSQASAGHSENQNQVRRKSAPKRTCCTTDHLSKILPCQKSRGGSKVQSTSMILEEVEKKQDQIMALELTEPEHAGKFTETFAQIQMMLNDVVNKHKAENDNLTKKYRIASDSFKHGSLREQLSSLASRQKCLLDILQRQNKLKVRFQMLQSTLFQRQTLVETPSTSMNICDAQPSVHETQQKECRTSNLGLLSEENCTPCSDLSPCNEAVLQNFSDRPQGNLDMKSVELQIAANELPTDTYRFFDSFLNADNHADRLLGFPVQASPVALQSTAHAQSRIAESPSQLAHLITQGTIKPGDDVFKLKLKGRCYTGSLQENGCIKDTSGQVYISPEEWIGSVLGPNISVSPTYAWKKVIYRSKPLSRFLKTADPVADDCTESQKISQYKVTPPGELLKDVSTEASCNFMTIKSILLISDSEFMSNNALDQHWNQLLESGDWTF